MLSYIAPCTLLLPNEKVCVGRISSINSMFGSWSQIVPKNGQLVSLQKQALLSPLAIKGRSSSRKHQHCIFAPDTFVGGRVDSWCHSGLILILAALQSPPTPQNWSATVCLGYEISMELGAEKIYGY